MRKITKKQVAEIDDLLRGWYGLGWSMNPDSVSVKDVIALMSGLAVAAHVSWQHDVMSNREPNEDVSPAEGILRIVMLLKYLADKAGVRSVKTKTLIKQYYTPKFKESLDSTEKAMCAGINGVVPGYFKGFPDGNKEDK